MMKRTGALVTTAALASLTMSVLSPGQASAQRCVWGENVRGEVAAFVHSLRDDVHSEKVRHKVRSAMVESVRAARGAKADSPAERRGLGAEIRVLARQLKDAKDKVARDALLAQIHALQDEKKAAHTDDGDVQELRSDVRALGKAISARADTRAEGRQVAAFVHDLMAQFDC
jgi:hypothetical protein